jgi:hypothetical protein
MPCNKLVLDFRGEYSGDIWRKKNPKLGVWENYADGRGQHSVSTTLYEGSFPGARLVWFIEDGLYSSFNGVVVLTD